MTPKEFIMMGDAGHRFRVHNDELLCRLCGRRYPNDASSNYKECPVASAIPDDAGLEAVDWIHRILLNEKTHRDG